MKFYSFFFFILLSFNSLAQNRVFDNTIIEFDPETKVAKKPLPFDKAIYLKFPKDNWNSDSVFIIEYTSYRFQSKLNSKGNLKKANFHVTNVKNANKNKYVTITPKPNRFYEIIFISPIKGPTLTKLNKFNYKLKQNNPINCSNLEDEFNSILNEQINKRINETWINEKLKSNIIDFKGYCTFFNNELSALYDTLNLYKDTISINLKNHYHLKEKLIGLDSLFDKKEEKDKITALEFMINDSTEFFNGIIRVREKDRKFKANSFDIHSVAKNLNHNIQFVENLLIKPISHDLKDSLEKYIYHVAKYKDINQKIIDILRKNKKIIIIENSYFASSYTTGAESTIKQYVKPDIGIAYIPNNFNPENSLVRPYLGVNFYFRPINEEIPRRFVSHNSNPLYTWNESLLHYLGRSLSFQVGLTLNSIEKEGIRKDLTGNYNLITGVSWRITHVWGVSVGAMIYNKVDTNPLIDKTTIDAMYYTSITIDLKIKKILPDFTTKLGY